MKMREFLSFQNRKTISYSVILGFRNKESHSNSGMEHFYKWGFFSTILIYESYKNFSKKKAGHKVIFFALSVPANHHIIPVENLIVNYSLLT